MYIGRNKGICSKMIFLMVYLECEIGVIIVDFILCCLLMKVIWIYCLYVYM